MFHPRFIGFKQFSFVVGSVGAEPKKKSIRVTQTAVRIHANQITSPIIYLNIFIANEGTSVWVKQLFFRPNASTCSCPTGASEDASLNFILCQWDYSVWLVGKGVFITAYRDKGGHVWAWKFFNAGLGVLIQSVRQT